MEKEGIEIVELSEDEINQLAQYVRENTWPKLKERMTDELIDGLIESIK